MSFADLAQKRRSAYKFTGELISPEVFSQAVETASLTPSGYNAQPWKVVFVQNEELLKKMTEVAFGQQKLLNSGTAVLVLADLEIGRNVDNILQDWLKFGYCKEKDIPVYKNSIAKNRHPDKKEKMALRNGSLFAMTLIYALQDLGWNTCPMMGFGQKEMMELLEISSDYVPVLLLAVGKEDLSQQRTRLPRKNTDEIIIWK